MGGGGVRGETLRNTRERKGSQEWWGGGRAPGRAEVITEDPYYIDLEWPGTGIMTYTIWIEGLYRLSPSIGARGA